MADESETTTSRGAASAESRISSSGPGRGSPRSRRRSVLGGEPEPQDYLERYPDGYTCHFIRPGWKLPHRADSTTT